MIKSLSKSSLVYFTTRKYLYLSCFLLSTNRFCSFSAPKKKGTLNRNWFKNKRTMSAASMNSFVGQNEVQQVEILSGEDDDFGGVVVEMNDPLDSTVFASMLRASIQQWKKQGKKGVWIKVPIQLVNLVEAAVKQGFWFHHAEPSYLMLVYWIPEGANTLPVNATHRVGVGAFVMNEKGEMLLVEENGGISRGTGRWKIPTGVVNEGEDIYAAAVREVKEETGVDTEFVEVLAFRQSHKAFFEKSDLFFLCKLRPLSYEIQKQETEIEAAQWMPYKEYVAQPYVQSDDLSKCIIDIGKKDGKYSGFSPPPTTLSFSGQKSSWYLNSNGRNRQ